MATVMLELAESDVQRIAERVAAMILGAVPKAANDATELLDVPAAAKRLKCSVRHLRHLIKMRRVAVVRLTGRGARVRISLSEIERVITESTQVAVRAAKRRD